MVLTYLNNCRSLVKLSTYTCSTFSCRLQSISTGLDVYWSICINKTKEQDATTKQTSYVVKTFGNNITRAIPIQYI